MTRGRRDHPVGQALTVPAEVIDAALRAAGRALWHPVSSTELNRALRESADPDSFRKAVGQLAAETRSHQWMPIANALVQTLHAGQAAGGSAQRGVQQEQLQRLEFWPLVNALNGVTSLLHANAAVLEWWLAWPPGCDYLPDDEEQALFERWKTERLRRRTWPSLAPEERVLLARPVFELVYLHGAYGALLRRAARWPLWRFRKGEGCRRHDALDGLCAPGDHPAWASALPPLSYFCDCCIEPMAVGAQAINQLAVAPSACRLFGFDKRADAAGPFVLGYIARMQAECHEDDADCGEPAKQAPPVRDAP
jgi:hypothetical protein